MSDPNKNLAKEAAGKQAAALIQDGMVVGLGTGSTAAYFIEHLITRCKEGLKIQAVSSSKASLTKAVKGGIPIIDINTITAIDMTVDGADEIDPNRQMIKGGGGALLREKILAKASKELVIIVDESKCVDQLGKVALPLEVTPFGWNLTEHHIQKLGYKTIPRKEGDEFYLTDNGNYILDVHFEKTFKDPQNLEQTFRSIPGVLETGFFLDLATKVIVGRP